MTISIGSLASQPKTEFNETAVDRVTSSQTNKAHEGADVESTSETTTLVAGAANLAALKSAALEGNGVRTDKVEQLRQAISAGTYKVEPSQVADAMLAEWRRQ
jgi:flagellar biosynthesis anti-sigma factor FlgM